MIPAEHAQIYVAEALELHQPSSLPERVHFEHCERDLCTPYGDCEGHMLTVCAGDECWGDSDDGYAVFIPWPCSTARALGVEE